jgi:hypothetical protein
MVMPPTLAGAIFSAAALMRMGLSWRLARGLAFINEYLVRE